HNGAFWDSSWRPIPSNLLQCPSPPAIANGKPSVQASALFTTGTSVNYSCEPSYSLTGQASIYCTASGTWSPPPPRCEGVLCITPEIENGRKVAGRGPVYRPRDTVRFECDPGYTLNETQCQDDGRWDPSVPVCERMLQCPSPPAIANGKPSGQDLAVFTSGMSLNYSCEPGYSLTGQASIYCTASGTWSPPPPQCEALKCLHFRGQNQHHKLSHQDTVAFECDPGYTLNGSLQIQCRDEGTWDPPVPTCAQEVLCIAPEIQHGRKVAGHGPVYRPRDTVRFECDPGYTLNGSRQIQCQDDRTWDPPVPVCIQGKSESIPVFPMLLSIVSGLFHSPKIFLKN
uniref:Sushi domain-containing protein n=1 Tax=Terrapene triunguis TaxID=2587831 RepID=A0A674JWJ9_9SAUR